MMIDPQAIAFLALTGLMGHALFLTTRTDGAPTQQAADGTDLFWTSERFNQSGEGHERPFFLE